MSEGGKPTAFTPEEVLKVFTALGADDPQGWADSEDPVEALHRFVFLDKAWSAIPDERDHGWIDADIASYQSFPYAPFAGSGRSLARLRELGASDDDLTELVRAKMAELLFHVAYLMADPGYTPADERYADADLEAILDRLDWGLCAVTGRDSERLIDGLHESILETDPMHREAAPRSEDS